MRRYKLFRTALFMAVILSALVLSLIGGSAQIGVNPAAPRPKGLDVRGPGGVPKGTELRAPTVTQLKYLRTLERNVGAPLKVEYNGLTATPRHLFSYGTYLTQPSTAEPEQIARQFISSNREIFRFSDADISGLRLKSRATVPDMGTTILLFEQTINGLPVYKGEVLVNVSRAGRVMSVGGDSFPQMNVTGGFTLSPAQAVTLAAAGLNVPAFVPQSKGTKKVLRTFGDLKPEFSDGNAYSGGSVFSGNIVVTKTIFPLGNTGRPAYEMTITTPQYNGIMWLNIVDAQTGAILRRSSLTSFTGDPGGGTTNNRRSVFRPDFQTMVEGLNPGGTAYGKVFDGYPTGLSGSTCVDPATADPNCDGAKGYGRSPARGVPPSYAPESKLAQANVRGRGFRQSLVLARNQGPFAASPLDSFFGTTYNTPFGQVLRGFADAANPTASSPFGWFYLPTGDGGTEITSGNTIRAATRAIGYTMHGEAQSRNLAANSPAADKSQPFAADLTSLLNPVTLKDGRNLPAVFQSRYTEGNNVFVADDHANDDEGTHGVKGYSANRQFSASYFDFINSYEYGNVDAADGSIPSTASADVYPAAATLFYYNNIIHDYLYSIGFTEPLWNFQLDNFGKGGAAGDAVSAQVQDGSGVDNANFGTPNDGSAPRMQMYLFTEGQWRRADGDFDWDIVAHEHYHGVSNRSAGKGTSDCLGVVPQILVGVGEAGGQGEGWSDFFASSVADDDSEGEYATGEYDKGIRRIPVTNYRWSYKSIEGGPMYRRDFPAAPDPINSDLVPFEVHSVGEVFSAMLWDMRELLIMKEPGGQFFDGDRRLGNGSFFYIGNRQVRSVDARHPIDFRLSFNSTQLGNTVGTTQQQVPRIVAAEHIVRPGRVAAEVTALGNRNGPLATAISRGARLADTLVLRALQISVCNPSIVDTRDSILLADTELTGGENRALIWRAFASHGVGVLAASTSHNGSGQTNPGEPFPTIVEDFSVPQGVTDCETLGPLPAPNFSLTNSANNQVTVNISAVSGAANYIISRGDSANGPFTMIAQIPGTQTTYVDNNGGQGLPASPSGRTYYYQVRAARNAECISTANTESVVVTGVEIIPAPIFNGLEQVADPRDGSRLILSWGPAVSLNPNASIVFDIYRVNHAPHGDGTQEPTFTPDSSNRIAQGVTGTSYTDNGLVLGHPYYYIVQARDTNSNQIDTNNTGNHVTKFNAPTIPQVSAAPVFALENFEAASASNRFTPPLTESSNNPNQNSQTFQRVTAANIGGSGPSVGKMYAPDFSPGDEAGLPDPLGTHHGAQSDFSTVIGPFSNLTPTSILEFDNFINAEATFDGGVIDISVGAPPTAGSSTPFPDNTTIFDAGNYMIEGAYNGKLDGAAPAGPGFGSILQGRRAYSGVKPLHHVRIALNSFAPGGIHNAQGLPVYVRFRMTSDVASANGLDSGWYIDNLVINNLACHVNVAAGETGATATGSSTYSDQFPASSAIDGEHKGTSWGSGGGWNDNTRDVFPDSLEVAFNGTQTVNEIRVYTVQNDYYNAVEPTPTTPADIYGIQDFDVQYWNGSAWVTVPGGSVTGNDKAMRIFTFPDITTTKIRVVVNNARAHFSRIVEVEAFGCSSP